MLSQTNAQAKSAHREIDSDIGRSFLAVRVILGQETNSEDQLLLDSTTRLANQSQNSERTADEVLNQARQLRKQGTTESLRRSIEKYEEAYRLFLARGDETGQAIALNDIGLILSNLGQNEKSIEYYKKAMPLWRSTHDQFNEATTLTGLGVSYTNLGDYQKALDYLLVQSLPLRRIASDQEGEAFTLNAIGVLYNDIGEYDKALEYYFRSLTLWRHLQDRIGEGSAYNNIGFAYGAKGDDEKALSFFARSLTMLQSMKYYRGLAHVLNNIGRIYRRQHKYRASLARYQMALSFSKTAGDSRIEAIVLNNIGTVYQDTNEYSKGMESLYEALLISRSRKFQEVEGRTLGGLMSIWRLAGKHQLAIFYGKQAVNTYQDIRSNLQLDRSLQKAFLKSKEDVYRELADILVSLERLPEAQQVLNLLKEEEYFEYLRQGRLRPQDQRASMTLKEAEWERRYREISDKLAALGKERGELLAKSDRGNADEQRLKELEADITVSNQAFRAFLEQLSKEFTPDNLRPDTKAVKDFRALQSTLRELGPGTVALYTIVLKDKYRILIITPDVAIARQYDIPGIDLNRKVLKFREALQNRNSKPVPLAQEMYKIIVGPVANDLKGAGAQTLMWVLDGTLRYLPVAALHDGNKYIVETYRNVVFTPASPSRLKDPVSKRWQGLGFGVSKPLPPDFPALPAVPEELRAIIHDSADPASASGVIPGTIKLDDDFTEDTMKSLLRQTANQPKYHVVHIASHFKFEPGNETTSVLLLGKGKTLTLDEIENSMTLEGVELLTLSACDTAVGGNANGKEVEGFAVTAQRLGAKSVIATLWPVADQGASHLMQEFYRSREGNGHVITKAEALRQTQVARIKGGLFSHPYYWAPFVLIGNWK